MFKIFCTKSIPIESFRSLDKSLYNIEVWDDQTHGPIKRETLLEKVKDADALITMLSDQINRELIDSAKKLKVISQFAVGHNNIDSSYAKQRGIYVTNTPEVLTHATAELAFSLLVACARKIDQASSNVKENKWKGWEPLGFLGKSLKETSVGIIGAGRIGQEFARMCRGAFNSKINYCSRSTKKDFEDELGATKQELEILLKSSDIISIHTPLTEQTRHLLDKEMLEHCKDDAILINTARGEIIDQDALISIIKKGKFFAVGLDVTTPEPLPLDSALKSFENVLITPHIGSATTRARLDMGNLCVTNVESVLGKNVPPTPVNA